jgi:iron complex outermembrane receptor protein
VAAALAASLAALSPLAAQAQSTPGPGLPAGGAPASANPPAPSLGEVTVTGNPLGAQDLVAPAAAYSGKGLLLRSGTTLGETLDNTPGVSSTYFGPNASRPIIRGLDGDRIRILQNSGATVDAAGLSYDHAVPSDPLTIERIEVLRGPAALLYGGNAIGGVVNVIDNRIPREPLFDDKGGVTGKADLGLATGNRERGGGLMLETGTSRFGLHADVFDRRTQDVRVPAALACTQGGVTSVARRICNSASDVNGGAVGGSLFFDHGFLGASASTYRSNYGTVAEDEVTIGMRSNRYALEGELRNLGGFITGLKGQFSHSEYQHTEFDAGAPGTVFKNRGNDFRLEARHAKLGPVEGVIGLQGESARFSADGTEAFAPYSRTRQTALFAYEELPTGWGKFTFGARAEQVQVDSQGNPLVARFVPGSRKFNPHSLSMGALVNVTPAWQLTSSLSRSERAPKDYELFADGPHVATGAWEVGDATLGKEKSTSLDVGAAWKSGAHRFGVNAFYTRFSNFLSLQATGNTRGQEDGALNPQDADGDGIDDNDPGNAIVGEYAYRGVRARFTGVEANGNIRLLEGANTVDLALRGDLVRAVDLSTGQPLPRIAPVRLGATLAWSRGPWGATLGFDHAMAQTRVPVGQAVTGSYTLWNAGLTFDQKAGPVQLTWFARLNNASDTLAYSASSILTQTAPGRSPLPGRSLKLGVRASF